MCIGHHMLTFGFSELTEHFAASHALGSLPCALLIAGSHLANKEHVLGALLSLFYKTTEERIGNHLAITPIAADEKNKTKKDITIEQIRELKTLLRTHVVTGTRRVVTIAPAETMSMGAANALLKVLEEPPASTHFILLTDAWQNVPATILSRCECYMLAVEPAEVYAACASEIVQLEKLFGMPIYAQRKELEMYLGDNKDHIAQRRKISELFIRWYCAAGALLEKMVRTQENTLRGRGVRPVHLVRFMHMITDALHAIEHNIHPKLIFENIMIHFYAHI